MSDLKLRLLSALVLGPCVLALAYLGGLPFTLLALVAVLLFQHEWFSITGTQDRSPAAIAGYAGLIAAAATFYLEMPVFSLAAVFLTVGAVLAAGRFNKTARWGAEGVLYSGLALISLLAARLGEGGLVFAFFLLVVVWATDICAYFVGRAIGGPKLWRKVSPNKTWSGALGGLFFSILLGTSLVWVVGHTGLAKWALLAAVLSVVSQAGDLMESAIKRRFDVKDSSGLIPGHGGIMDRIDGLVAAAIAAAALGLIFGGSLSDPIAGLGLI